MIEVGMALTSSSADQSLIGGGGGSSGNNSAGCASSTSHPSPDRNQVSSLSHFCFIPIEENEVDLIR